MKRKSLSLFVFMVITCSVLLVGCMVGQDMAKTREAWSNKADGEICFGVAGRMSFMKEGTHFMKGIEMAVDEINQKGGIMGKPIRIIQEDDKGQFMEGTSIAQKFAENPRISAVIGHSSSSVAIPASNIYDNAKMVVLSPIASNPKITKADYRYVFQTIPNDNEIGKQMALYTARQGYKRVAIFYGDSAYGKGLANSFEDIARTQGVDIIDRVNGYSSNTELERIFDKWRALEVDAVFIADSFSAGKDAIEKIKKAGLIIPILCSDAMDAGFIESLGDNAEGVVLATFYNPYSKDLPLKNFLERFRAVYKQDADVWAIQGYDSIKLLAYAIEKAKSQDPEKIAEALRGIKQFESVTGVIGFDEEGRILGKEIFKKVVRNGKFEYIED